MVRIETLLGICIYISCLLGVAPLYPYLELPARLLFPAALLTGAILDRRRDRHLSPPIATVLSLAVFALYGFRISLSSPVEPVVNILALLLAIRLLTEKTGRNYLQIFVLAVFALASSTLLSISASFFVFLTLQVVFVTVGLVLLSFVSVDQSLALPRRGLKALLGTAMILPAVSLVLMLVFFVVLPRTRHPLWNFLNPAPTARAGFTDRVAPGSVAGVVAVKQTVYRVESPEIDRNELYWRGVVLNDLEGSTWTRGHPPDGERARLLGGRPVRLTFYPKSRRGGYLLTLDIPRDLEGIRARQSEDRVFKTRSQIDSRDSYVVSSALGGTLRTVSDFNRELYLEVPGTVSQRVRAVAEKMRREAGPAAEKIDRLEAFFLARKLTYATTDLPASDDPVDEFLFEKKKGYCEFFASSFALLLRLAGVPARLVGGYYGGEYNALGGYYLISEDTAHVWVEALLEDGRWVRIDPSRLASNADAALISERAPRLNAARRILDAVNYFWDRAVINYDLGRQMEFFRARGSELGRLKTRLSLRRALAFLLLAGAVIGGLFFLAGRHRRSSEARLVGRFLRLVRKKYRPPALPPEIGLEELAGELDDPDCREFARIYGRALYRDRRLSEEEIKRLKELLGRLKTNRQERPAGPGD